MFLIEIIKHTPVSVWVILVFMVTRGLNSAKDNRISYPKMTVIPAIFMVWGLEKLFTRFIYLRVSLVVYLFMAVIGILAGYVLYGRFRQVYKKDSVFYRTGTYLPLVIILINFLVKYILGVALGINPGLYLDLNFNILYSAACGFSVGLFMGGIVQAYKACVRYQKVFSDKIY